MNSKGQLTFEQKQKLLWQALTGISLEEMDEREVRGVLELVVKNNINNLLVISETTYPKQYLMTIDKVSNALFDGKFSTGKEYRVENSKKNKNLFAKVDFDFTKLPGVSISRNLDWHDRVVHNAIISLCVDGKNEYITPLMIHRVKEGDSRANMTPKQKEDIENSIEILSSARICIDTKKDYGSVDKTTYTGNLIYTKKVDVIHKGEKKEWIYIMEEPILYQYAHTKNQIANTPIQTNKTPVNKTKEIRILQEYLLYRIKTKGMSNIIRYDTIYEKLGIKKGSESSLRKKRNKIRKAAKTILDDFIGKKMIKGYKENTGTHNEKISIQFIK